MEIPASMILDWAKRIDGQDRMLNTAQVAQVCREMRAYATETPQGQEAMRRFFYNRGEA